MRDVLVIGAGPAGMTAALELQAAGFTVTVADDQPAPGGRIFAAIETRHADGAEDRAGASLVARFRSCGGQYLSATEVWQVESGPRVFLTQDGRASMLEPRFVLLATGAQERPMPFPGWELPGVMTVGGAQILLKTARQIPDRPVWLAGTGPLLLLYANQLIAAGGSVAGIIDTTPPGRGASAIKFLPAALDYGWRDMLRGLDWMMRLRSVRIIRNVAAIEATGSERLATVRYTTRGGVVGEILTELLFVHDGVVPALHGTLSANCMHCWNPTQRCFEPVLDQFGASSDKTIFVAGDGATIAGARAAMLSGRLAAIGIALAAGKVSASEAEPAVARLRRGLASAARFRRFIDALYPPVEMPIPDATMLCRCEEVTAGQVRTALKGRPHIGPDGVKIATRAGMGPCQGRQCGLSLTRLVAEVHGSTPADIGFLRIRPPLKPLTLGELASLESIS
jgi:NADPH-dependent 2,4-dienoyl-CoA reductase/sulfur reductase-like enzyme